MVQREKIGWGFPPEADLPLADKSSRAYEKIYKIISYGAEGKNRLGVSA